jgi:hypothetical protein
MAHVFKAENARDLVDQITHALVYNQSPDSETYDKSKPQVDMVAVTDTHLLNVVGEADSMEWEFDLKEGWLLSSRWSTLVRQYLNPEALESWKGLVEGKLKKKARGTAVMRFNTVAERGSVKRKSRRWGACMLGISFRRIPWPQITLYSRTSYFGYIAYLDLTMAYLLAKECEKITGIPVADMKFVWHIEDAQWSWKSCAWLFQTEERKQSFMDSIEAVRDDNRANDLWDQHPGMYVAALWLDRFLQDDEDGVKYSDMSWAACARVRRRYHTEVMGYDYGEKFEGGGGRLNHDKRYLPMPHKPAKTLSLDPIYKRNKNALDPAIGAEMANHVDDECVCGPYLDGENNPHNPFAVTGSIEWQDGE